MKHFQFFTQKKARARVTPEICTPTILWMNTSDTATFDSASSNLALRLADERFSVNCELEHSHVTSRTMKSGVHPDADGGGGLTSSVTHTNTWAAIILDHIQLFLCNGVNYFRIICQYELRSLTYLTKKNKRSSALFSWIKKKNPQRDGLDIKHTCSNHQFRQHLISNYPVIDSQAQ